jgi:hypothetical protein
MKDQKGKEISLERSEIWGIAVKRFLEDLKTFQQG